MTNSKKILITGGAGFIGSALIRYLIKNTSHEILNFDALKYSGNLQSLRSIETSKRYNFLHGDICDPLILKKTLNDFRPDGVINLAAESHVDRSIDDAAPFIQTNIVGTYSFNPKLCFNLICIRQICQFALILDACFYW